MSLQCLDSPATPVFTSLGLLASMARLAMMMMVALFWSFMVLRGNSGADLANAVIRYDRSKII